MILRFARRTLMLAAAFLSAPVWPAEPRTVGPAWVVDPAQPGDHLPPTGASLFDTLFADGHGGHALPFPFEKLLARLDGRLSRDPTSPLPPAKRVLIPLGRSLQRTAAAPDYFAFPRVVVAVDTAPAPGAPLLKDRLYLGYQEKSAVLEVISYNEAAGRFEFQLVKDYRAGGRPQVFYANRHICFACHQNGAPIFSRALWDETNANPAVAARLAAAGRSFYGIPPERGVDVPYAIDKAVRRANRFALAQRLWREGCGAGEAGVRCRAGLFAAALRLRFADGRAAPSAAAFDAAVARPLRANGARLWPAGLAIGRADLPNRNPLQGMSGWPDELPARVARSHVSARFEPLLPRPSEEAWRADAPEAVAEAVAGVAEFISDDDRRRIERRGFLHGPGDVVFRDVAMAAERVGARVIATDCHPDVPAFLERNAALAEVAIEYRALDWRQPAELDALREQHGRFDLVLGSDLLYEAELADTLGPALARLCRPRTRVLLADPGRPHLQDAVSVIERCGFRCGVEIASVPASLDVAVHGARGPEQQELFLLALALTA